MLLNLTCIFGDQFAICFFMEKRKSRHLYLQKNLVPELKGIKVLLR